MGNIQIWVGDEGLFVWEAEDVGQVSRAGRQGIACIWVTFLPFEWDDFLRCNLIRWYMFHVALSYLIVSTISSRPLSYGTELGIGIGSEVDRVSPSSSSERVDNIISSLIDIDADGGVMRLRDFCCCWVKSGFSWDGWHACSLCFSEVRFLLLR